MSKSQVKPGLVLPDYDSNSSLSEIDDGDQEDEEINQEEKSDSAQTDENSAKFPSFVQSSGKQLVLFRNHYSEIVGIHRCVLFNKSNRPETFDELNARVTYARKSRLWAVLLFSGGKFAAAIFDCQKPIVHKTFSRYTVRAKQGGSQSLKDSACGGAGGPKSAGASLRRYGELAIRRDISNLLHWRWLKLLQCCDLIFTCTTATNRSIFFNPPTASQRDATKEDIALDNSSSEIDTNDLDSLVPNTFAAEAIKARMGFVNGDSRLRSIPFRSRTITYASCKDLHNELSHFEIYDKDAQLEFLQLSDKRQQVKLDEQESPTLHTTESGRYVYVSLSKIQRKRSERKKSLSQSSNGTEETSAHDLSSSSCFNNSFHVHDRDFSEQDPVKAQEVDEARVKLEIAASLRYR
ncbi:Ankyrin repeat and zinc finger domain-containing protein 1 [Cichlidogyrus casuarinus]|uniref:Ankyrin repeat and zinc finger domain-containing protein 1 n=1 Tax=Cichlidogyrus casuarinus TaxID=1844966 RepID=A0ABD2QBX4_9PLAT